ncbi:uncharacterized protein [Amphiura filiformis]
MLKPLYPPSITSLVIITALGLLIYNEYIEFMLLKHSQWTQTSAHQLFASKDTENQVRVLFVGDPQIQGYRDEPALLGYVTRWDADRYLQRYFQEVMDYVHPEVVILMGDLLDEGSIANDWEFDVYAQRLKQLYAVPENVKLIYVAGDNDIGGERASDPLTDEKIQRFERHFGSVAEPIQHNFISFYKLNFLPFLHTQHSPKVDVDLTDKLTEMQEESDNKPVKILLSHNAISETMLHRHIQILQTLKPQYAFCAHTHYTGYLKHNLQELLGLFKKIYPNEEAPIDPQEDQTFVTEEYRIPTCSYRMGVPNMAYAAASIDKSGQLTYTLLWLPSRYKQLYRYAVFAALAVIVLIWKWCVQSTRRKSFRECVRQTKGHTN